MIVTDQSGRLEQGRDEGELKLLVNVANKTAYHRIESFSSRSYEGLLLLSQITKNRPLGYGYVVITFGPGTCSGRLAREPSVVADGWLERWL